MPDYIQDIPNGTMMIRDTGGEVQFWFKTGSSTFNNQQNWGYASDTMAYQEFEYRLARGGNWQMFGSVNIDIRQNVLFRIVGEGLGWPTTDFNAFIERARQPDPPQIPALLERYQNQLRVAFNYNYDGGMGIDAARLWWSYDGQPRYIVDGRDVYVTGLAPKTGYSFWGEVHNPRGWSGLGPGTAFSTYGVPDAPTQLVGQATSPTTATMQFDSYPFDGGTPIREFQIAYGTDPNTAQVYLSGTRVDLTNLQVARQYYFWSRARNDIGWGPWSVRKDVLLPAGSYVQVAGAWRRAVPWVRVNGVWKITRPFVKDNGIWRPTSS